MKKVWNKPAISSSLSLSKTYGGPTGSIKDGGMGGGTEKS